MTVLGQSLRSLGIGQHQAVRATTKHTALQVLKSLRALPLPPQIPIQALRLMAQLYSTALPVVDAEDGGLVGTITASDLRGLGVEGVRDLILPVLEWKARLHPESHLQSPARCCSLDTTLGEAAKMILEHNIHRLWFVLPASSSSTNFLRVVDETRSPEQLHAERLLPEKQVPTPSQSQSMAIKEDEPAVAPAKGPFIGVVSLTDVLYQFAPWHNWRR